MSGGYWEYGQHKIREIIGDVEESIEEIEHTNEYAEYVTLERDLKILKHHLSLSSIYMQRLDWLLSGDDGIESYHSRLKTELDDYFKTMQGETK